MAYEYTCIIHMREKSDKPEINTVDSLLFTKN